MITSSAAGLKFIKDSENSYICKNTTYESLQIFSGVSYTGGGHLVLSGLNSVGKGAFTLCATNGSEETSIRLTGYPNKVLTWNNNDLGSMAITQKSFTPNGYMTFQNGLWFEWGIYWKDDTIASTEKYTDFITFPITFMNNYPHIIIHPITSDLTGYSTATIKWASQYGLYAKINWPVSVVDCRLRWFAINRFE